MGLEGRLLGGRYRIRHLLGSGGMGAVYAAEQEDLRKQVAVKVLLHHQRITPTDLARFKQEALAAAKLGHPNIVQVNDFQAWPDEPPLLVMEMLQGESLHARLTRAKRLAPERAIFITKQVLAALAAAHAAGIVHRDIKPANIFLTQTPAMSDLVKVLDFGIAKAPGLTDGFVTAPGAILGTPAYMAPEQARAGVGDHRIDLYSVGVCLFEMLVGRRPYQAKTFAELIDMFEADCPTVRSLAPEIDPTLAEVVDRALRRDPRHRPQRAVEMLDMLTGGGGGAGATVVSTAPMQPTAAEPRAAASTKNFTLASSAAASTEGSTLASSAEEVRSASSAPATVSAVVASAPSVAVAPQPVNHPVAMVPATLQSPQSPQPSPERPSRGASPSPVGADPPRLSIGRARVTQPSMATNYELSSTAMHSLFWSIGGLLMMCFPIGIIGVVTGLRARSIAVRVSLPTPITAVFGIVLGGLGSMASLALVSIFSWGYFDLRSDNAEVAARIAAIERRVGDTASARELEGGTACGLAEVFVLRNGVEKTSGWQIEQVACQGAIARSPDQAALENVQVSTRGRRFDLNVCFTRAKTWVVTDVRKGPCPMPASTRPTPDAGALKNGRF